MSSYRKRSKCAEVPPVSEGYEAESKHTDDTQTKFEDISKSGSKDRLRVKAVSSQQVDKVGQRQIEMNVFHAEQYGKSDAAVEERRLLSCEYDRQDQNPVHEAIVLEMDVIDDQKAGRQQN
ncbi:unnamed protein product [Aspergillus oryzae]|nr:unnamed protein product [Aspergillus oryzae]GMF92623.1 unnamed protein product [Aspergillus oryzae]